MTNGDNNAFASSLPANMTYDDYANYNGLTKREYFAAMAMQGIMASWMRNSMPESNGILSATSCAVEIADALIKALNKEQ